jgi:NAD dependent epimerase/dehydratase family enzyme
MSERVVVVGATGTIGRPLCAELSRRGYRLVVFSRDTDRARHVVADADAYEEWGPNEISADCREQLRSAHGVIYLAGGPLFDGKRHDRRDVEQETTERIRAIDAVVEALAARPSAVFIAASSVGYYGYSDRAETDLDETSPAGIDWWGKGSAAIEQAALGAQDLGVRTVTLRTGYVLTA